MASPGWGPALSHPPHVRRPQDNKLRLLYSSFADAHKLTPGTFVLRLDGATVRASDTPGALGIVANDHEAAAVVMHAVVLR